MRGTDPQADPAGWADPARPAILRGTGEPIGTPGDHGGGRADPATRGRLLITDRVVEKIAAEATRDIEHVGGLRRVLPRRAWSAGDDRPPRVSARVSRGTARISMSLSVRYPARIMEICDGVRTRVTRQVADLAGLRVTRLDIDVSALDLGSAPGARVR
ncbi:Asp23/Gls24 family envelope stress response protein [Protofrankia coriariae]|uniref:Asp23/Gls24 family envelope stress response protein n=1 Tax=Protofrankia coriariae TaxID=1562887 RepID=UPI00069B5684|nr:Asp23/Gls24 family envelope stress response protein [Protofrankia coriariae]